MTYSTGKGVLNVRTRQHPGATLADLREQHRKPRVLDTLSAAYHTATKRARGDIKKGLDYFVGGALKGRRHDDNITARTFITLDIEAREGQAVPPPPQEAFDNLQALGAEGWVYTSLSHTPAAPRYRVVLPLGEPITGDDLTEAVMKATTQAAAKKLGLLPWCTSESWVLSQPMFLPAKLKDGVFWEAYSEGKQWRATTPEATDRKAPAADIPDRPADPVLRALQAAGSYIQEAPRHPGMHYIRCPWANSHSTDNDSKTVYYEAHHDGNPRPACKCMSTSHEELTYPKLVQWLRDEGHLPAEAAPDVLEDVDAWAARAGAGALLAADLPPVPSVWDRLAQVGEVTAIVGPGGVSKSAFALRLAYEGANGRGLGDISLGDFAPVRSIYLSYEDGDRQVQKRLKRMANATGAELDALLRDLDRTLKVECVKVKDHAGWKLMLLDPATKAPVESPRLGWLTRAMRATGSKALFVDTGIRSHELDELDPAHMTAFVMGLQGVAQEAECAVFVLLHATKFAQVAELEDINQSMLRGSSATADACRSAVVLLSLRQRWAHRFGLPATKDTVDRFFVLFHVKHNHTAPLPVMVFERDGPVVLPRPDIKLLAPEEVAELRDKAKQTKADADTHARAAAVLAFLADKEFPCTDNGIKSSVKAVSSNREIRERVLAFLGKEELVDIEEDFLPPRTNKPTTGYTLNAAGRAWLAEYMKTNRPWGASK